MPTLEENLESWDRTYEWKNQGEEWSTPWGGSEAQWSFAIYPRLRRFVPAPTILEIAPGHGRFTHYLKSHCQQLIGVDISPSCVEACKRRFADWPGGSFFVNDGRSLPMVLAGSIHLAFSFDSLVHVERDAIGAYLAELARTLAPRGVAFLHHSNLGAFVDPATGELPSTIANPHWRATSVSAAWLADEARRVGLAPISQELIKWGKWSLCDCFSVLARPTSSWMRDNVIIENPDFMKEASHIRRISEPYVGRRAVRVPEGQ